MAETYHDDFAAALLEGGAESFVDGLQPDADPRRFAVYRNNVARGGIEALRAAYPAVNRLVGADFFAPMAKAFWQENPPRSRSLTLYGAGFEDHVRGYGPAQALPYLPGVAALDRAWLEAHHAAEGRALTAEAVAQRPPEDLPALAPGLRPDVRLVRTDWACFEIWKANRSGASVERLKTDAVSETSLIWRPRGEVWFDRTKAGEHVFLLALSEGLSLERAAADGIAEHNDFNPAEAFGRALERGLLAG